MSEKIRVLISEQDVNERILEISKKINEDYQGKEIHMICVLKGGVFFMCELAKRINVPVSFDFMSVSSYGDDTKSSGVVRIVKDLDQPLEGKDVVVVEDILDTARTLYTVKNEMLRSEPASLKIVTLLDKPSRRVVKGFTADYTGFAIEDHFVVGYGLDYNERFRNLPYVGILKPEVYT